MNNGKIKAKTHDFFFSRWPTTPLEKKSAIATQKTTNIILLVLRIKVSWKKPFLSREIDTVTQNTIY